MPGLTSISGLIAGWDVKGAVNELLGPRQVEIDRNKQLQTNEITKQDSFAQLNGYLRDLRNVALNMKDSASFYSYSASLNSDNAAVPASSLLSVSGTNAVNAGNHTIIVEQLAQEQRNASSVAIADSTGAAAASDTAALGLSGTFQINGQSIAVTAADSLQDIVGTINSANAATGVSASVIKVANSDYRLVLAADETGAAGFTLTGADLDADTSGTLAGLKIGAAGQSNAAQTLQVAQDAKVNVDGLSVFRSSNSIGDVLSGVTLDLKQASPATKVTMSIGVDQEALRAQVQTFVDAYNNVSTFINDQFAFNAETGQRGVLAAESILTSLQSNLTSKLLQSVPGLANDRNSLVKIGVEPDAKGQLTINDTLFSNFLNNDADAIRDVFVAAGSSTNADIQFLVTGDNTPSGNYALNITTAAARASVTGTTDLVGGTLAANETVTLTEASNGRQAIVNLTAGQNQSALLNALNSELSNEYTEIRLFDQALLDGALPATGGSTFTALGLGAAANDTITISGTNRSGVSISNSFTILDPATDTLSDLLSAIQSAFGQQVVASIDANGRIQVADNQAGDSQLSVQLTANNEGAGTLALGVDSTAISTEGRYAMSLEAVASGNGVTIQHKQFGSNAGFSIAQTADGLGIADNSFTGVNVAGTINGEAATGTGQTLLGSAGNVDGLAILYTGTATGAVGSMTLNAGTAALLDGSLDIFSNPFTGLIQNSIVSAQGIYDSLDARIIELEVQMEKQRELLLNSFAQMEAAMASLRQSGDFLTQQMNALNSNN